MKRKRFLGSLMGSPLLATNPWHPAGRGQIQRISDDLPWRIPPYLKPGDTIGITCPAGFMTPAEIQPAVEIMRGWGFNLRIGKTVGVTGFYFWWNRCRKTCQICSKCWTIPLSRPLCVPGVDMACVRIIDQLDFRKFTEKPKWIIGFSDITVFHAQLNHQFHIASIHSKMCNSFPDHPEQAEKGQWESILSIQQALTGKPIEYPVSL